MCLRSILVPEKYIPDTQKAILDNDIAHIMAQKDLPTETKYMLYQNILHQYKQMHSQLRKPLELDVVYDQKTPTINIPSISLTGFPKSLRHKAKNFIDFVQALPDIKVADNGELYYKNNVIRGSNFIDLVNDFVRNRKNTRPPTGARELALALRDANVPREVIGNRNRWDLISGGPTLFSRTTTPSEHSWKSF